MGHKVSTLTMDPLLTGESIQSCDLNIAQSENKNHQKQTTSSNIGNACTSSSSSSSSRTLTLAILLCAATSNHFSGVTTASSCRNSPSPPCAYAMHRYPRSPDLVRPRSALSHEDKPLPPERNFQDRGKRDNGSNTVTGDCVNLQSPTHDYYSTTNRTGHFVGTQLHPITSMHQTMEPLLPSSSLLHTTATGSSDGHYMDRLHQHHDINNNAIGRRMQRRRCSTEMRISTAAQLHYDDALLERIIKGQHSNSPRWRKRTRHAAASFGFRLEDNGVGRALNQTGETILGSAIARTRHKLRRRNSKKRSRRKRKMIPKLSPKQYETKKLRWAEKYTSISTLRTTFGTNRNKFWGDFDPATTRRLYNTLLPRALLGLYEMGPWSPNDLAPLAYEARMTAKKYARERCVVPGRLASMLYDGYRSWRDYGTWSVEGLSWEQIWYKYETQVLEEMMADNESFICNEEEDEDLLVLESEEEVTAQIYLRILERSCITNERINQLLMGDENGASGESRRSSKRTKKNAERYLRMISAKLEMDMEELMKENEHRYTNDESKPVNGATQS